MIKTKFVGTGSVRKVFKCEQKDSGNHVVCLSSIVAIKLRDGTRIKFLRGSNNIKLKNI